MAENQVDLTPGKSLDNQISTILEKHETVFEFAQLNKLLPSKRWLEIHPFMDESNILHLFEENGEYLLSNNGNISKGFWKTSFQSEVLVLDISEKDGTTKSELYEMVYSDENYIFLMKHGVQNRFDQRKYLALGEEEQLDSKKLNEILEELGHTPPMGMNTVIWIVIIVAIVALIFYFSS